MARQATGQLLERPGKAGMTFAARVTAYGKRHYVTLGSASDITRGEAFQLLRYMSQTSNRKLRDVAHAVLEDGTRMPA